MKKALFHKLLFCFFLFVNSYSFAQKTVPELWGQRVHDDAHALKQETVDHLEKSLKAYEDSTSNQIAILLIQSLDGDVIEEYSIRVAEKWKLGQKGKDNGVLLLVAVDDHKMRIEVGQGLEGVLTDALSSRIIRNEIAPEFRRGDYDAGVIAGISGIIKAIGGEYKADNSTISSFDIALIIIAILFFGGVLVFSFIKEFRSSKDGKVNSGNKINPTLKKMKNGSKSTFPVPFGFGSGWSSSSGFSSGSSSSSFFGGGGSLGGGGSSGSW
ncbi:MAG TPA: hypothetical protein DGG95_03095 [Cytophagales bacterium]|jgi:uncharacterized protein|nr:hypothetical protein [Cytophagales bacterium]